MTVLIVYATAHGSTRGIAERVAERLGRRGFRSRVVPADIAEAPLDFEAAIIGSAIHSGDWLPAATDYVHRHREALRGMPVWLFSVSSFGSDGSFFPGPVAAVFRKLGAEEKKPVTALAQSIGARDLGNFTGAITRRHWPFIGHVFLRVFGGRYGDHRNWPVIEGWADGIAAALDAGSRVEKRA